MVNNHGADGRPARIQDGGAGLLHRGGTPLLKLSPAAVSKNIGALEGHLNVRLLSLTEAGGRYFEQIARILDDLDEADRSLGPCSASRAGCCVSARR
ncbi:MULTISPECIES: hypothetical protein [Paracoccus]|uniref:hypothetical protein n=1 Tax=Paracoccus TaxID=265 RepID=UPI001AA0A077|nr:MULTISPECIES: hypothetical protein [Paracoccus]MBT0783087.1 hypothetical protein [Paracoccus sp. pheM1]